VSPNSIIIWLRWLDRLRGQKLEDVCSFITGSAKIKEATAIAVIGLMGRMIVNPMTPGSIPYFAILINHFTDSTRSCVFYNGDTYIKQFDGPDLVIGDKKILDTAIMGVVNVL